MKKVLQFEKRDFKIFLILFLMVGFVRIGGTIVPVEAETVSSGESIVPEIGLTGKAIEETTSISGTAVIETSTMNIIKNGFSKKKNGKIQYYVNGELYIGWLTVNGKKYYFNSKGNMVTGSKKINGSYYYFDAQGCMQTGFVSINSKKYYYSPKTGKKFLDFTK